MDDEKDPFAHRKAQYKQTLDEGEARRKREEHTVKLGKSKKLEQAAKRRQAYSVSETATAAPSRLGVRNPTAEDIPQLIRYLAEPNDSLKLEAVTQFRKMLSKEENPPINEVIRHHLVPQFVELLSYDHVPKLQFEAAWALTNIASGTSSNTKVVIDAGAVPEFVRLLDSDDPDTREQAVWALGNIAGDSPHSRNAVLRAGALPGVLKYLGPGAKLSFVRNATWTLSNFLRGKPAPDFRMIADCLPMLARLIYSEDVDILTDGLWALSYFTDGDDTTQLQQALEAGVASRICELLMHPSNSVKTPALRTVGNIVTGDEVQTQVMINAGALPALLDVLAHGKSGLKKEACWAISNVMAGSKDQVEAAIAAQIVPELMNLLKNGVHDIKKEACWAISNATSGGTPQHIQYLQSFGAFDGLASIVDHEDTKIIMVALEGIENMLKGGEVLASLGVIRPQEYVEYCENIDFPRILDECQESEDSDVHNKAKSLMKTWFRHCIDSTDHDDGDEGDADTEAAEGYADHTPGSVFHAPATRQGFQPSWARGQASSAAPGDPGHAHPPTAPHQFSFKGPFS